MNADYYNAEPGYRSIDEMFYELSYERAPEIIDNWEDDYDNSMLLEDPEPETDDDIDDAYDREGEEDEEEESDYEGEEDFDCI